MFTAQKQICVTLLFGTLLVTNVDAAEPKDYRKIIEPGFAHLTCAAYGMLTGNDRHKKSIQRSFSRGSFLLAEWLIEMKSGKPPMDSVEFVPKRIRLVPVPYSNLNFHLGYIWAQVESDARLQVAGAPKEALDRINRESDLVTLNHLEFGFGEESSRFRANAEMKFKESNCEVLR